MGYFGSAAPLPTAAGDVGSYMFVTRADGTTFSYNSTTAGSNLRRVGTFAPDGTPSSFSLQLAGGANINIPNIGNITTWPVGVLYLEFSSMSVSGTWLALGSIGVSGLTVDGAGTYSYVNYRSVHLAIRVS
jgi:hypothetical protein